MMIRKWATWKKGYFGVNINHRVEFGWGYNLPYWGICFNFSFGKPFHFSSRILCFTFTLWVYSKYIAEVYKVE